MAIVLIRWILGLFCIFFAGAFGKSAMRFRRGQEKQSRLLGWALRTVITGAVVPFRFGFDRVSIAVFILAAASFAAAAWFEWRPKHHDDLTKMMFPGER